MKGSTVLEFLIMVAITVCLTAVVCSVPVDGEEKPAEQQAQMEDASTAHHEQTIAALREQVRQLSAAKRTGLTVGRAQELMTKLAPMMGNPKEAWKTGAKEYRKKRLVHAISYGVLLLLALFTAAGSIYGGKEATAYIKKDNKVHGVRENVLLVACGVLLLGSLVSVPIFAATGIDALGDYTSPDLAFANYLMDFLEDMKVLK